MRHVVVLACVLGCGRLDFSPIESLDHDASVDLDGAVSTGPVGPRWIRTFTDRGSAVAGRNGRVDLLAGFVTDFGADPNVVLHGNAFSSSALVRYAADGSVLDTQVFDATGFCEMRSIASVGDDVYVTGATQGTTSVPAYGACSIATNRQDPVVIRVDAQGAQTLVTHWIASVMNAQTWAMAALSSGTFALAGPYSGNLTIGTTALPAAGADTNAWVARSDAAWSHGLVAPDVIQPGKIAASGDETCVVGAHHGPATMFGTAVPYVSGYDTWVARLDADGNARFVRGFGSPGNESNFGNETSVVALADGGCLVGIVSDGDITLDSATYPAAMGRGFVVRFAADGSVVWGRRMYTDPMITVVGNRVIGAFTAGDDVIVLELDPAGVNDQLLATVGGSGMQTARELVTIGPDAVAITVSTTGELTFGATSMTKTARAVAVLGI